MTRISDARALPVKVVLCLALVLVTAPGLVARGAPARAASTTATVTGTVLDQASGLGRQGVRVTAWPTDAAATPQSTETDVAGHYQLTLPIGQYRFSFLSGRTIAHWYGGGELYSASTIVSVQPQTTLSTVVKEGGRVEGTYTGTFGTPVVLARRTSDGISVKGDSTVADGRFEAWLTSEDPVHVGLSLVSADSLNLTRWNGGKYAAEHSTPVQVDSGSVTSGLGFAAPASVALSGRTTNVAGIPMRADVTRRVLEDGDWVPIGRVVYSLSSTGVYQTRVPADAVVTLHADGLPGDQYERTWWGDTTDSSVATRVEPVAGSSISDVDIAVRGGTPVVGSVEDVHGLPLEGVTVTAYRHRTDAVLGTAQTDADGRYAIPGLGWATTGGTSLRFSGEHLVTSWSGNQATQATSVVVGASRTTVPQQVGFVPERQLSDPAPPTLTSSGLVGSHATALAGEGDPRAAGHELRWYCGERPLGHVGPTYLISAADVGCALNVRQVSLLDGWGSGMSASPSVPVRLFGPVDQAFVYGAAVVGTRVRVTSLRWTARPDRLTYQWFRGRRAITGAVAPTYLQTTRDIGSRISVRITAHRDADGLSATRVVQGASPVRARSTLRVVRTVSRRGSAEITLAFSAPGAPRAGGRIVVTQAEPGGRESSVRTLTVSGAPQTITWTFHDYRGWSRLIYSYTGSPTAAPTRISALVYVR